VRLNGGSSTPVAPKMIRRRCHESTKLGLAKAAAKAAEHFAEMPSSKLVRPDASTAAKTWTQTGEIVFGWKQEQPASGIVSPLTVYSRQTVIGISDSLGKRPQE